MLHVTNAFPYFSKVRFYYAIMQIFITKALSTCISHNNLHLICMQLKIFFCYLLI